MGVGHDHHFLSRLDRIEGDHVDIALGLYRDHQAVQFILDHLSLRRGQDRIALALGKLDRGPYVILASNGHFVTCLGEGMSTGSLDIVPRERVDELLAAHRDTKGRESVLDAEKRKDENRREFFGRLFHRANMLSREEFVALSAFGPLIGREFFLMSVDASKYIVHTCAHFAGLSKVQPKDREVARSLYEAVWNVGHFMLLAGMAPDDIEHLRELPGKTTMSNHVVVMGNATSMFKGVWAASRLGKRIFPQYERMLDPETPQMNLVESILVLVVLALRDETLKPAVRRALSALDEKLGDVETDDEEQQEDAHNLAAAGLKVLENPDEYLTNAVLMGKGLFMQFGKDLPKTSPYHFTDLTAVPEDLAAATILSLEAQTFDPNVLTIVLESAPLVAMAKAEDFYFPREAGRAVLPEWEPEVTLRAINRFGVSFEQQPKRVENKVGRNDPCPCGSGKKYKKCHGK